MASLEQHSTYTGAYSGLLNNFWVTLAIASACLIGYEIQAHVPRRRGRDGRFRRVPTRITSAASRAWNSRRKRAIKPSMEIGADSLLQEKNIPHDEEKLVRASKKLGSRESWEFGYIYQPKAWRINPSPPLPRWPLAWIVSSLKIRERDMPRNCGLDITLHARFLRGCFFYAALQCCVVLPVLLPLHILYAPSNIGKTSMNRASVSSLVLQSGTRWLWVHAILIWYITFTWTATVLWITWGGLAYRRRETQGLALRINASRAARRLATQGEEGVGAEEPWTATDDCAGVKRFKTIMMTNVPPDMRDERILREYFDRYLQQHRARIGQTPSAPPMPDTVSQIPPPSSLRHQFSLSHVFREQNEPKEDITATMSPKNIEGLGENGQREGLHSSHENLAENRTWDSEVEEVTLVRKVFPVASLRTRRQDVFNKLEIAHVKLAQRVLHAVAAHQTLKASTGGWAASHAKSEYSDKNNTAKQQRMDTLVRILGRFVKDPPGETHKDEETIWDALHSLPRELLDPYQSLTHLTSIFRDQNAPLIDYLTTKARYLTALLDEARTKPLTAYCPSSAAFITFKDARTARLALKILESHPKRSLACHTVAAPAWSDLLWPRLEKNVYRSSFVRGWVVFLAVWAFTLVWIFPVSLLAGLASFSSIAGFIPILNNWLLAHPKTASVIESLAPVILVALLTISICPILLAVANKAETINTRLDIHNSVLERFWKFLMVNSVVFFAIGQTAIEAYLTEFQDSDFDPLPLIASSFPSAAPYFASYVLLQIAIQPFFEIYRFGLPTIVYVFGTRIATIPRQRNSRTEHPTFSHFSAVPLQLLIGAIMHLFMVLNPLVIPFSLIYYGTCYLVWKRQFTYVYGRLYEDSGRRTSIRVLRYSLDALALAQFVLFAFFILNKAKAHAITTGILFFLTLIAKLIITRALKRRHEALAAEEADILCPAQVNGQDEDNGSTNSFEPETAAKSDGKRLASQTAMDDRLQTISQRFERWTRKWRLAAKSVWEKGVVAHGRPIPFDNTFFSFLDRAISFDNCTLAEVDSPATLTTELQPPNALDHEINTFPDRLVQSHPTLMPWEDIPPYHRARAYDDQPEYTNDFDDFLWLPRDPLATLDLDDTVELRLALTSSTGGSGVFGKWSPVSDSSENANEDGVREEDTWQEVVIHATPMDDDLGGIDSSPDTGSERRLMAGIHLPPNIGSEVEGDYSGETLRRGSRTLARSLSKMFQRPRALTNRSDGMISMRTVSISVSSHNDEVLASPPLGPLLNPSHLDSQHSQQGHLLSPTRTMTPRPMSLRHMSAMQAGEDAVVEPDESLSRGYGVRAAQTPADLGRSASGRRPSRVRSGSRGSGFVPRSASETQTRSRSVFSLGQSGRNRSPGALSGQQQALLHEVMEEERLARKDQQTELNEHTRQEEEELQRERLKTRQIDETEEDTKAGRTDSARRRSSGPDGPGRGPSVT